MADFKFNFGSEENEQNEQEKYPKNDEALPLEAKEVNLPNEIVIPNVSIEKLYINGEIFMYKNIQLVEENLENSSAIVTASTSHSDLIPAIYEGGLKVWECTIDLIQYLVDMKIKFQDKRVLEVGCGAGLPGIYALKHGAQVDFQDYNEEIVREFTIPNVWINLLESYPKENTDFIREFLRQKCHFYCGDWTFLTDFINTDKLPSKLYDIILTSETIYNVSNYEKLVDFCRKQLKYPNGIVYVAAKTYYFGVGGGTRSFEDEVRKSNDLDISVCKTFTEGLQREILEIRWRK